MKRPFPWFRAWSRDLSDPVLQGLTPRLFRHWYNLSCLANECEPRGSLPRDEHVAFKLRVTDAEWANIAEALLAAGILSSRDGALVLADWKDRQYESDTDPTAAERKTRQRERDTRVSHAPVTRDSRPPDTETDPDTEAEADPEGETPQTPLPGLPARPPAAKRRGALTEAYVLELSDEFPRIDVRREVAKFRDWNLAHRRRPGDESAAFRNWLRKEQDFQAQNAPAETASPGSPRAQMLERLAAARGGNGA